MQLTRFADARPYEAPEHFGMLCLRLQGKEATTTDDIWIGISHILPGGHTAMRDADVEKLYVVISGEVTIETLTGTATLGPMDSCRLAPGEARALYNRTNVPASILLAMPTRKAGDRAAVPADGSKELS